MDIVLFLLAVVNLILALVVLFGGRFFLQQIEELREDIEDLQDIILEEQPPLAPAPKTKSLEWDN